MSRSFNNTEEDVMDLMSNSDNFDLTSEAEKTLLEEEDSMAVDSPIKTCNETTAKRKPIVFDLLNDSIAEEDNEDIEEDNDTRDKFKSERKTVKIPYSLNDTEKRKDIPDNLDGRPNDFKQNKNNNGFGPRRRRRDRKSRPNWYERPRPSHSGNRGIDLRQLINSQNSRQSLQNYFQLNQGLDMNLMMKYQMDLGILDPLVAQNQMLINALVAQNGVTPLLNRISAVNPSLIAKKPKDDIQITVVNDKVINSSSNSSRSQTTTHTITQTRPQIRRQFINADTTDSTDCEVIENVPSVAPKPQTTQRRGLNTLFSKHLANKVNQRAQQQNTSASNSGLFGDALAEVEVGVDNDYLRRMQEQEVRRLEVQRQKEERRLQMADERLESALKIKEKIRNRY